ncbi:hypothetical protein [Micavibrio aeruginosavorus]|uniref:hypothetical protein n=1 Tax=Micavibrio aeruginosavorus TaxID=349221 RepID=UPI003F4AAB73
MTSTPEKGELKKRFNKPRLYVPYIQEITGYDHPQSGARLVLGRIDGIGVCDDKHTLDDPYVVVWIAPERTYVSNHMLFVSRDTAEFAYKILRKSKNGPGMDKAFTKDWQKNRLYQWEYGNIDGHSQRLSDTQMRRVIERVSNDFNLAAPALEVDIAKKPSEAVSYYYFQDHKIKMATRRLSDLLHELAHMVDDQVNHNVWSDHGPSFARTLIYIAEKYQWFNPDELIESAEQYGLKIANMNDLPELKKRIALIP